MGAIYTRTCKANRGEILVPALLFLLLRKRKRRVKNALVSFSRLDKKTCGFATKKYFTFSRNILSRLLFHQWRNRDPLERKPETYLGADPFSLPPPLSLPAGFSESLPSSPASHIYTQELTHTRKRNPTG